jgi:hypothetical protein
MTAAISYDELVLELRARGVPLEKAEVAARRHVERFGGSVSTKQIPRRVKKAPPVEVRAFLNLLERDGVPAPELEWRFSTRKWRLDFAWIDAKVALEVEGGVWTGGRHVRPKGFLKDVEKYNHAALLGWRLIRCTPSELGSKDNVAAIKAALA